MFLLQAKLLEKFLDDELPTYCKNFEKMLIQNDGGVGYFVGNSVSTCKKIANIFSRLCCTQ